MKLTIGAIGTVIVTATQLLASPPKDRVPTSIARVNVEQLHKLAAIERYAWRLEWVPLSDELAVLPRERDIEVFDGRLKSTRRLEAGRRLIDFAFSRDGEWLASSEDNTYSVTVESLKNGTSTTVHTENHQPDSEFSPDGKWLVTGGYGTSASLWQLPDGKKVREFSVIVPAPGPCGGAGGLRPQFSPDGRTLAIGNRNSDTRLFDPATGQLLHILPKLMTQEIKFNPAGTVLATTYVDGTIGLWDVATGKSLHEVKTAAAELYTVDWSPDGKLLATAGHNGKIILWDAKELKPLNELEGPDCVIQVRFSPDGSRLFSAGCSIHDRTDRKIIIWGLDGDRGARPK
jgi:WD40 repeat protein